MAALPTGRVGQALAAMLLASLLLCVWVGALAPLLAFHTERGELLQQHVRLATRMEQLVGSLSELERQAIDVAGPVPGAIIEAGSDAVAAATMQQAIQDMAARAGAALSSSEALPAEPVPGYRRVGLRVAMTAPWPVLVQLLRDIHEATPQMLIDDLQIHGGRVLTGQGAPPLDLSCTVLAFRTDRPAQAAQ